MNRPKIKTNASHSYLWTFMLAAILSLLIGGCSSKEVLSEQSALESFPTVAALFEGISEAQSADVPLLAPNSYDEANKQLAKAMKWAQANDPKSELFAKQGQQFLDKAVKQAAISSDVFEDILNARQKAVQVGAPQYYQDQFNKAEQEFLQISKLLDGGNEEKSQSWASGCY